MKPSETLVFMWSQPTRRLGSPDITKDWILRHGRAIGYAKIADDPLAFEVIVWTDSMRSGDYGLYTGFKIFYDQGSMPYFARLFCFYDGKDKRSAEIKFKSETSAREYMRSFKNYEELS